jgi:hypothetical protein
MVDRLRAALVLRLRVRVGHLAAKVGAGAEGDLELGGIFQVNRDADLMLASICYEFFTILTSTTLAAKTTDA